MPCAAMGEVDRMEVYASFVSCGCNRCVNAAAWGPSNLVAFAAHNAVAIFSPQRAEIVWTLPGHKDLVNCVEWLPKYHLNLEDGLKSEAHYLLSGSADGIIILWAYHPMKNKWRSVQQLPNSHLKAVSCLAGLMLSPCEALFSSCSSDCTVRVWRATLPSEVGGECKLSFLQCIATGSRAVVAVSLALLPDSASGVLLAMGGLDNNIHLHSAMQDGQFVPACILKGHQDWVRSLDFAYNVSDKGVGQVIYLASAGQDRNIRIWRIGAKTNKAGSADSQEQAPSIKMYIEGPVFRAGSTLYQASMESLLTGHDDWVYSVKWQPPPSDSSRKSSGKSQQMSILSASMDRTMMIWRPDPLTGLWLNEVTVGELGHTALGFYGGLWSPAGDAILAHAFGGSFHLWKDVGMQASEWQPQLVPSGHAGFVSDIAWAKNGQFLLSTSHDQTTRLYASWNQSKAGETRNVLSWHEIARPQVHGHDLNCLAVIKGTGNYQYVSGAEEKVARVFEAPGSFLMTLEHISKCRDNGNGEFIRPEDVKVLGANMSALGLSQKPIYVTGSQSSKSVNANVENIEAIPDAVPVVHSKPPLEEDLGWNTLWPETHKLYGHGNELFAMCSDYCGRLMATACKGQSANVADIWLWEVHSWKALQQLHSHSLTVTQMEFSHDDKFLLSVSRDRHFSLFRAPGTNMSIPSEHSAYELVCRVEAHKRIIWSCSWSPCDRFFATASRDKVVKIWGVSDKDGGCTAKQMGVFPMFKSSVTAVAWAPCMVGEGYLLGIGMEDGLIELWKVKPILAKAADETTTAFIDGVVGFESVRYYQFDAFLCHVASVNRLAWRKPGEQPVILEQMQLASCGADHAVRIFSFKQA
ncbi:hypothetical protein GOP47_0020825 [Adiantum capillus-veneris]|uniref:Elongator complex protein 2 n=1 Tax=Adiantum capillus-veneris TaxID=13818 RepID=A0A9D4UAF3_ADICA|nr:hypothetical protein GOP47_0020825 [Adiantum capillus-veneris]